MDSLRIAIGQTTGRLNDTYRNVRAVCQLTEQAAGRGARLILFPEAALTGYAVKAEEQATLAAEAGSFAKLVACARRCAITICVGFATPLNGRTNIVHAVVRPDGEVLFQRKSQRTREEPSHYAAWDDPARVAFDVDGCRVAITICCEFGVARVDQAVDESGARLILHPSAGSLTQDELIATGVQDPDRAQHFRQECRELVERACEDVKRRGIARIAANPIGFDGTTWWPGNSYAIAATGEMALWVPGENRADRMHESVAVADLEIQNLPLTNGAARDCHGGTAQPAQRRT